MSIVKTSKNRLTAQDVTFEKLPKIKEVAFIKDEIAFVLTDERVVYIPLKWSKKLLVATPEQRKNFITNGYHVFWDSIDEIIGVKNILYGKKLVL
jgi:hypothetical protein